MPLISSLQDFSEYLRDMMGAETHSLEEVTGDAAPFDGPKLCAQAMYYDMYSEPTTLNRFAATILKSRSDPTFGEIELINTGE